MNELSPRPDHCLRRRLAGRRRAHAVRRLQRHAARCIRDRPRHQGGARGAEGHGRAPGEDRRRGDGLGGADELRCLLHRAPHRPLCGRADRGAGAAGAAAVHLGVRGHPAGGRPAGARQVEGGAVRGHRIHVAQPDRRLYAPRRLQDGPGRVQGLPVGGDARYRAEVAHGRHRRGAGQALPDHARGYRRLRRRELRAGHRRARGRLLQGRGRAGDGASGSSGRATQTREIRLPRKVAAARRRRASAADAARGAEGAQARLQGRADRRQQLGHRRRRRRGGRGRQRLQRGSTAPSRLRASSPAPPWACRRRSWGSGRRRRSAPCSPRPA